MTRVRYSIDYIYFKSYKKWFFSVRSFRHGLKYHYKYISSNNIKQVDL